MIKVCYTTCSSSEEATYLARSLLNEGLCACVNFWGITSLYTDSTEGIIEGEEIALFIKTTFEKKEALEVFLKHNHPYNTPCILWIPCEGEAAYAAWCHQVLRRVIP